ncbi:MAG: hypothetical protein SFU84_11235 [Gemmatimonadales bacterium]|nr:hypothetical protein [Gemmatimonadales bacterium]
MAIVEPESRGGPSYQVTAIRGDRGDTLFSKRYSFQPIAIPARVIDSTRQEKLRQPGLSPAMKSGYQALKYPSHYPPIRRVLVGIDGTIWLQEENGRTASRRWIVLSASGARLGSIEVPAHVGFGAVSRTRLWTIESDADGVQSIGQYRVGKLGR